MLLTNCHWLHADGTWHGGSIRVSGSRIAQLTQEPLVAEPGERHLDCRDCLVLPGAIDAHVHFREPGLEAKEGIENGCRAALAGGVTTVLEMPNTVPACCSRKEYEAKRLLFTRKAPVNWGLFFDVSVAGNAREWPREQRPPGKLYMAKSSPSRPVNDVEALARIFSDFPLVAIHAEDEKLFVQGPVLHHEARPRAAIVAALRSIEQAWEKASPKPHLVLCHAATLEEVEWLKRMRGNGASISGETCPHYLLLTQEDYVREGAIYKVNPPLRTAEDAAALHAALREGVIDFLCTDHAPHLPEEKSGPNPPSGIAGIEWYLPLALHIAQVAGLSTRRLHEIICTRAARVYGIRGRDGIAVGNRADIVVLNRKPSPRDTVVTRARTRPFAQVPLQHSVRDVLVNGNHVYVNGDFVAAPPAMEVLFES